MKIGKIAGATRVIGESQGYLGLPLRDVLINCSVGGQGTPAMETAWHPTPGEIAAIIKGAPIILRVIGRAHPPVMLETGEAPRLTALSEAGTFASAVSEAMQDGKGFWRSCSGCHELDEGHSTGPYSKTFKCHLGVGCYECGGIGAIWDTTDYAEMGAALSSIRGEQP